VSSNLPGFPKSKFLAAFRDFFYFLNYRIKSQFFIKGPEELMARLQISGQNEERLDKNAHFCMRLTQPWIDALHFVHPPNLPPPNDIFQAKPMLSLCFPSYADQEFPPRDDRFFPMCTGCSPGRNGCADQMSAPSGFRVVRRSFPLARKTSETSFLLEEEYFPLVASHE
jgi:hypothetical protein